MTGTLAGICMNVYIYVYEERSTEFVMIPICCIAAIIAALPAFIGLLITLPFLSKAQIKSSSKWQLLLLILLLASFPYGVVASLIFHSNNLSQYIVMCLEITGALWLCNIFTVIINYRKINSWIQTNAVANNTPRKYFKTIKTNTTMQYHANDGNEQPMEPPVTKPDNLYNRILIKGGITAGLILAMLIPASYVSKLVDEREQRHHEVVHEVSEKWASAQTITTPYLYIPYLKHSLNDSGKAVTVRSRFMIPAKTLEANASMQPEVRKRSIYEVLLYRSNIDLKGTFVIEPGKEVKPEDILFNEAKLCIGITDLQGVEEKVNTIFNTVSYDLEPGLPVDNINSKGLSAALPITAANLENPLAFALKIKLKGSSTLHFIPLAEESSVAIQSPWQNPSFDGKVLPNERDVSDKGFTAKWRFNKANMPLINQLSKNDDDEDKLAFGVSMIQPGDQYAKTNRSVKYAILFIGLSFAMFFITELVQAKPVHPVQYILIGLALIIFYTLLLSVGEFTGFNIAYGIASASTILLVALYAVQLFKSIATGTLLGLFLGMLYGYIYVLIQLEDTALLAGSISLFILLAVAMFFSRKINWYGTNTSVTPAIS